MFLTGLLPLAYSACFLIEDYQPRDGTTHQLKKCLTAGSHGGISSREAPFSVINPACVKLTHKSTSIPPKYWGLSDASPCLFYRMV